MTALRAPAKVNLALVVGPLRDDGKHEVVTILQPLGLHDRIEVTEADRLVVSGYEDDTIVAAALGALAAEAGVEPRWRVDIAKAIPVAAGLGGGSSDAAAALRLANELLPQPLDAGRLSSLAAAIGADVPFFLEQGPQLGTGDGTILTDLELPQDFTVVLALPAGVRKSSTADVYARFDARSGMEGFPERRAALFEALAAVSVVADLARLPLNDLESSPLSLRLLQEGAFRADVSGAGPCVYGLFDDPGNAETAARSLEGVARALVTAPPPSPGRLP